jgi:RNA polymerase sigma factor (sigma-70 family)
MKFPPVLVRLAQAGHPYAVNSLLSILGEQAQRRLLRATKDSNLADESSQAARIGIWRHLHSLDASRNVAGYAHLTATHEAGHAFRRRTETSSLDELLEQGEGNYEPAGREPSPLDALIREEETERQLAIFDDRRVPPGPFLAIHRPVLTGHDSTKPEIERDPADQNSPHESLPAIREWLAQLPPHKARLLRLRFVEDLSPEEIAERLGKSPGTIRSTLTRMMQAIRTILDLPLRVRDIAQICSKTRLVA